MNDNVLPLGPPDAAAPPAATPGAAPRIFDTLQQLTKNARINKHQHFSAAERNHVYHNVFGSTGIVINVVLSSLLFVTVSENLPDVAKWTSAFLAVIAAGCGAIQTFFNFQKSFEGHRKIANRYLEIQRECERLCATFVDGLIDKETLAAEVRVISKEYTRINNDAEVFPTVDRDFQRAMRHESSKGGH